MMDQVMWDESKRALVPVREDKNGPGGYFILRSVRVVLDRDTLEVQQSAERKSDGKTLTARSILKRMKI